MIKINEKINPIESLFDSLSSSSISDIVYLCEHGLIYKINQLKEKEELVRDDLDEEEIIINKSNVFNYYFYKIMDFLWPEEEIVNFINNFCVENFSDNHYIKNNNPYKSIEEYFSNIGTREKLVLYFYKKGLDLSHNNYEFFNNLIINDNKTKELRVSEYKHRAVKSDFKICLDIIGCELGWENIKNSAPLLPHLAVAQDNIEMVNFLEKKGFNFTLLDEQGYSVAFKVKSSVMLKEILKFNPKMENNNKKENILNIIDRFSNVEKIKVSNILKDKFSDFFNMPDTKHQEYKNIVNVFKESSLTKKKIEDTLKKSTIDDINMVFKYDGRETTLLGHFTDILLDKSEGVNLMKGYLKSLPGLVLILMERGAHINQPITYDNKRKDSNVFVQLPRLFIRKSTKITDHKKNNFYDIVRSQESYFKSNCVEFKQLLSMFYNDYKQTLNFFEEKSKNEGSIYSKRKIEQEPSVCFVERLEFLSNHYKAISTKEEYLTRDYEEEQLTVLFDYMKNFDSEKTFCDLNSIVKTFFASNIKKSIMDRQGYFESKNQYLDFISCYFENINKDDWIKKQKYEFEIILDFIQDATILSNHLAYANLYTERLFKAIEKNKQEYTESMVEILEPLCSILERYYTTSSVSNYKKKRCHHL